LKNHCERNILSKGDPDQEFDPYTDIWIYKNPEVAIQNPKILHNLQHILQLTDNLDIEENLTLN
jgi:hypothetical protein